MKSILLIFGLAPFLALANACNIAGSIIHWKVDYCLHKNKTDDFFNDAVQLCFEKEMDNSYSSCEFNIIYKRKICELEIKEPYYDGTLNDCIVDPNVVGSTVLNDGAQ